MKGIDSSLSNAGLDGQRCMHLPFELVARLARDHTDGKFSELLGKASLEAERLACLADRLHGGRSSQQRHERSEYGLARPGDDGVCRTLLRLAHGIARRDREALDRGSAKSLRGR